MDLPGNNCLVVFEIEYIGICGGAVAVTRQQFR